MPFLNDSEVLTDIFQIFKREAFSWFCAVVEVLNPQITVKTMNDIKNKILLMIHYETFSSPIISI